MLRDERFQTTPERVALQGTVLNELVAIMRHAGWPVPANAGWSTELRAAIDAFTGTENLEERVNLEARTIDRVALESICAPFTRRRQRVRIETGHTFRSPPS